LASDLGDAPDEDGDATTRTQTRTTTSRTGTASGNDGGSQRRHRRVTLLPGQTTRNDASDEAFAVLSVLALDRHCTVGAMASMSTRSL
jgi:hypothetical protein